MRKPALHAVWVQSFRQRFEQPRHRGDGVAGDEGAAAPGQDVGEDRHGQEALLRGVEEVAEVPAILVPAALLRGGGHPGGAVGAGEIADGRVAPCEVFAAVRESFHAAHDVCLRPEGTGSVGAKGEAALASLRADIAHVAAKAEALVPGGGVVPAHIVPSLDLRPRLLAHGGGDVLGEGTSDHHIAALDEILGIRPRELGTPRHRFVKRGRKRRLIEVHHRLLAWNK